MFLLLCCFVFVNAQYAVPDAKVQVLDPKGFTVSIPDEEGIKLFAFHGKINEDFDGLEGGTFSKDILKPKNGSWTFVDRLTQLKKGDIIYYWLFVDYFDGINKLGYTKTDQHYLVSELLPGNSSNCQTSKSVVDGRVTVCSDTTVFEDQFNSSSLDTSKWIVEQYIPDEPDYEFVIYTKDEAVTQIKENQLVIKPQVQSEKDIHLATLDISNGCTRPESKRSRCTSRIYLLHNPVISGRIVSKTFFSYVDVEIKAKLPSGEWMYPEIYLEDENYNRLIIAYSRGNKALTGNNGTEIGGTLLFGGPMLDPTEPARSNKLSSYRHQTGALSDNVHIYRLRWTPEKIELFIDSNKYGSIDSTSIQSSGFTSNPPVKARLVLGIGVGGINDFPNDLMSGNVPKPWRNRNSVQVQSFYESRHQWLPSWNSGGQLAVDYVKIKSI